MTFKKGDEVLIKGTVLSFEEDEILDLEIATSENTFFINSEDVQAIPKKVVIPKFVAEWYKHCIATQVNPLENFTDTILTMGRYEGTNLRYDYDTGVYKWIKETPDVIQIVSNMHQFGYEIEQEQLYTVEVPNPNNTSKNTLALRKLFTGIEICRVNAKTYKTDKHCQLTEAEIKKDFVWAWQWAKPVEE